MSCQQCGGEEAVVGKLKNGLCFRCLSSAVRTSGVTYVQRPEKLLTVVLSSLFVIAAIAAFFCSGALLLSDHAQYAGQLAICGLLLIVITLLLCIYWAIRELPRA